MTDVSDDTQATTGPSIAQWLRATREDAGFALDDAAAAAALPVDALAALEEGARRPVPAELDRLSPVYGADLSHLLPPRRALELDDETGRMTIDGISRPVGDLADEQQVYGAYVSLLQAVRSAQPGERIALRSSDEDLLMSVLGEDPDTIERRLVALMGCSAAEASVLRGVLMRHRALAVALGPAAALGLVTMVAASGLDGAHRARRLRRR